MKSSELIEKIEISLDRVREGFATQYFTLENLEGETIQIRVANHSANKKNFTYKTYSFITERTAQRKSGYNQSFDEWCIGEDGMSDTYQTIEEILEWNEII